MLFFEYAIFHLHLKIISYLISLFLMEANNKDLFARMINSFSHKSSHLYSEKMSFYSTDKLEKDIHWYGSMSRYVSKGLYM